MARIENAPFGVREVSRENATDELLWTTYRWMSLGLALTGLVAYLVANTPAALELVFGNRMLFWVLIIAQLGLVVAFTPVAARASTATAAAMFLGYAALTGVTLSAIFIVYTRASIAQAFFVSAGAFAGLSVYGATTKRDLSVVGRFMIMGLFGVIIASVVNIFMRSPAIYWVTTYAGVLIFSGLTAYDTQRLRTIYASAGGAGNMALRGALTLYLDFINLFLVLLRLLGSGNNRR